MAKAKQRYFSTSLRPEDGVGVTEEFRNIYERLRSPEIASEEAIYFGEKETNGSWRIIRSGNNLVIQRKEAGSWVTKGSFLP